MTGEQLAFELDSGLCNYGLPKLGERRLCDKPATHAACWLVPDKRPDGKPEPRAGIGRIECCRDHAVYYANAWCTWWYFPGSRDVAWIDVLEAA